jgi:aminoglycoside phosphotransferase (APT) family kinase protein
MAAKMKEVSGLEAPQPQKLNPEHPNPTGEEPDCRSINETEMGDVEQLNTATSNANSSADEETFSESDDEAIFEDFKPKILILCHTLWPNISEHEILIEHIAGGTYNRIVGITIGTDQAIPSPYSDVTVIKKSNQVFKAIKKWQTRILRYLRSPETKDNHSAPGRYILRMPRSESEEDIDFEYDFALLRLLDGMTQFSVPKTICFDKNTSNPLGRPYVLQYRIPGRPLEDVWKELNHAQKLCVARQMGTFLLHLSKHTFSSGGKLNPKSVPERGYAREIKNRPIEIYQFEYFLFGSAKNVGQPGKILSAPKLLQERYLQWKEHYERESGLEDFTSWRTLAKMVSQMEQKTGVFGPDGNYYIYHGDLYPRNVMVEVLDKQTVTITGILDWDHSAFGPAVVAFERPSWLWTFDKYDAGELENITALKLHKEEDMQPENEQAQEIKTAFEEAVGPEFLRYAAAPEADIARWLWAWGVNGVGTGTEFDMVQEVLTEFGLDPLAEFEVVENQGHEGGDVESEGGDEHERERQE